MGALQDYCARGGLMSYVRKQFQQEVEKARDDEHHFLRPALDATNKKDRGRCLKPVFEDALKDNAHPLHILIGFLAVTRAAEIAFPQFDARGRTDKLERIFFDEALEEGMAYAHQAKYLESQRGASDGGGNRAKSKLIENKARDEEISASNLPANVWSRRKGLSERRIREIKASKINSAT